MFQRRNTCVKMVCYTNITLQRVNLSTLRWQEALKKCEECHVFKTHSQYKIIRQCLLCNTDNSTHQEKAGCSVLPTKTVMASSIRRSCNTNHNFINEKKTFIFNNKHTDYQNCKLYGTIIPPFHMHCDLDQRYLSILVASCSTVYLDDVDRRGSGFQSNQCKTGNGTEADISDLEQGCPNDNFMQPSRNHKLYFLSNHISL